MFLFNSFQLMQCLFSCILVMPQKWKAEIVHQLNSSLQNYIKINLEDHLEVGVLTDSSRPFFKALHCSTSSACRFLLVWRSVSSFLVTFLSCWMRTKYEAAENEDDKHVQKINPTTYLVPSTTWQAPKVYLEFRKSVNIIEAVWRKKNFWRVKGWCYYST